MHARQPEICELLPQEPRRPWLTRVLGIPPSSMFQTPAFPLGMADGVALRVASHYKGPLGKRGEKWLIRSAVQCRFVTVAGAAVAAVNPAIIGDTETQSAAWPVKVRIQRCGFPGWLIVDSDSLVVVDGGDEVAIEVMVPSTWVVAGIEPIETPNTFQYVEVRISACHCDCGLPKPPWLTWAGTLADTNEVVRPRRAKRLQLSVPNPAGATFAWRNGAVADVGSSVIGTFQINGGFVNTDLRPGSASHVQVTGGGGAGALFMFAWELE